jgi:thiamine-monophosphate kinase
VGEFASGLFEVADKFGVHLIGGDTTRGPVTVVTVAMTGILDNEPLLRSGAKEGDAIYVTGTVGDAAGALALGDDATQFLRDRFLRPTPRLETGLELVGRATAAIDVSDGLAGDLLKLLEASAAGGELWIEQVPVSRALAAAFSEERCREFALTGGDDYELCFTGPAGLESTGATRIGTVTATGELVCLLNGEVAEVDLSGYRHFS